LGIFASLSFLIFCDVHCSANYPYIYSAELNYNSVIVNQTVILDIVVRNPTNTTANIALNISAVNINFFPSNEINVPIPPRPVYSSYSSKELSFILKPLTTGEYPIEVQLWWNKTKVDSKILVLKVYDMIDPNLYSFYIRCLLAFLISIYTFIVVQLYNPELKFHTTTKSGETVEWGKGTIVAIFSIIYWMFSVFALLSIEVYYGLVPYLLPCIGRIEGILAIGVIISAFCFLFLLTKRYDLSMRLSYLILIFLFFSLIWDWILFPMPYLGLLEPIAKFLGAIIIEELLRIILKRKHIEKKK